MSELQIGIDITACTQDAEACPVLQQVQEAVIFCEQVSELADTEYIRVMLGSFASSCAKGTCPGVNIETTRTVLRSIINTRDDL